MPTLCAASAAVPVGQRCKPGCKQHAGSYQNIQQRFDKLPSCASPKPSCSGKNFFVHGALAMRPLVLREIAADELGLHESTISRDQRQIHGHAARYLRAEVFFGSGLGTDTWRQRLQHGRAR